MINYTIFNQSSAINQQNLQYIVKAINMLLTEFLVILPFNIVDVFPTSLVLLVSIDKLICDAEPVNVIEGVE